ncbi:hypothetical protein TI39_contig357g00014 [Zymoseptoria brevis]|uniref:Uncharacterized protein n=1 Tax=Zymoseptoria brevis TaxID=1047168 RepID=A0A0F4GQZ8_9PEZI|nr:hypothetical protein TI39_contig357g00014 [Zymoseptoria brevis]
MARIRNARFLDRRNLRRPSMPKATTPLVNRDVFRFFDLPRELRDEIHRLSLHDKEVHLDDTGIWLRPHNVAVAALLVLCRQSNTKYQKVANEHPAMLEIFDMGDFTFEGPPPTISLPLAADKISSLVLHLVFYSVEEDGLRTELYDHWLWITETLKLLPKLCNLKIDIFTEVDGTAGMELKLAPWLKLPNLDKLDVYDPEGRYHKLKTFVGYCDLTKPEFLSMQWTSDLWVYDESDSGDGKDENGNGKAKKIREKEELTAADDESDEEWLAPVNPYEHGTEEYRQFKREVLDA